MSFRSHTMNNFEVESISNASEVGEMGPIDAVLEQIEENRKFIQNLETNQLDTVKLQAFYTIFSKNTIWKHASTNDVRRLHLEEILQAIINYCQNDTTLSSELLDNLIHCFSIVLTTLMEWNKIENSKEGQVYMKDLLENVILATFKNNIHFKLENPNVNMINNLELSQIQMPNLIKTVLLKLVNVLISTTNKLTLTLSNEVNVVLVLMLLKSNELISQEKHKMLCVGFYNNVLEYFHQTLQDQVAIDYLDQTLFYDNKLNVELKFSVIIFVFDYIVDFYLTEAQMFHCENNSDGSRNCHPHDSKDTALPISKDSNNRGVMSFYKKIKEFSLQQLTNVKTAIRKSALYVMKRLYQLECNKMPETKYSWESFFHIFETLEETQVKLVIPVLKETAFCDDLVLRKILLTRMFQYDNPTIIKAGIEKLHLLNNEPDIIISLLSTIMKALNNSTLFVPESEVVKSSIVKLFQLFNKPYSEDDHYQDLINSIIAVPWGPVPLFYVTHYLQHSSNHVYATVMYDNTFLPKLSRNFNTASKLLQINFKHNLIIRSGIDHCLREHFTASLVLPLKHIHVVVDNMELVKVLNSFLNVWKGFEKLAASLVFSEVFMDQYINEHFIVDGKVQECSFNILALFFCTDLGKDKRVELLYLIQENMKYVLKIFENISKMRIFGVNYSFLRPLIWCYVNREDPEENCCFVHSVLTKDYSEDMFEAHFSQILENRELEAYGDDLEFLIENSQIVRSFIERHLRDETMDFSKKDFGYFKTEFNYLYIFNRFYNSYSCDDYILQNEKRLIVLFNKDALFKCDDRKSVPLKFVMFLRLCQGRQETPDILLKLFFFSELCIESLSNTNRDCLKDILEIMELLMPFCSSTQYDERRDQINEIVTKFMRASYKEIMNTKRTTLFRSSMKSWLFSVLSVLNVEAYQEVLIECVEDILEHEEFTLHLFKQISKKVLFNADREPSIKYENFLLRLVAKGLVYGDLPKRDILLERAVCDYIRENEMGAYWYERYHHSCYIRYKSTITMIYYSAALKHESWGILLLDKLMETFDSDHAAVQYFHNSLTHRLKQRAIQNILVLDYVLQDNTHKQKLFLWGLENILHYNHQPSIRYFLEWLIIRNLESLKCADQFWSYFDRAYDERPGSIVSFLSILFHVVQRIITAEATPTPAQASLVDQALERIIACSMSQLFNLRLYANVVFIKLYQALDQRWTQLSEKYQMVFNAMMRTKTSAKGNAILNAEKLATDFYFTRFHPFTQFSLETIFCDLPRLADVAHDEWHYWGVVLIQNWDVQMVEVAVPPWNLGKEQLSDVQKPEWIVTSHSRQATDEPLPGESTDPTDASATPAVSQKKFIPWKPPCSSLVSTPDSPAPAPTSQLIIVTSLIDKIPNIGGLSRSCEVFGASLVVDSLDILRDVEFKALSMTSEKHVNIIEVKRHNLKQYLRHMRCEQGYQLIGAEQTNSSVNLQDFKYPKKSILVLGNEREGIVSDILVLLDTYVEVPQLGVLRSLNVHVTGALFIWEYVKQHCLASLQV